MRWHKFFSWILNDRGSFAVSYDFSPNTVISSSNVNTNFADVETAINSIQTYISSGVITNAMLATINTAGKVSGAALTGLANTPSAAGILPVANGGTEFDSGDVCLSTAAKDESGWTEITSTYAGKYIRIGATALATGGSATLAGATGSHTLTTAEMPAHTHTIDGQITSSGTSDINGVNKGGAPMTTTATSNSTGGGGGHTHDLTSVACTPLYVDLRMFQKS